MRRKGRRLAIAAIREYVASEHERVTLRWALQLDDDRQAERSRRFAAACRAGDAVSVYWWELPDGAIPKPPDPNDVFVITAEGTIVPEDEHRAAMEAAKARAGAGCGATDAP
jgi:hypothetical protein